MFKIFNFHSGLLGTIATIALALYLIRLLFMFGQVSYFLFFCGLKGIFLFSIFSSIKVSSYFSLAEELARVTESLCCSGNNTKFQEDAASC